MFPLYKNFKNGGMIMGKLDKQIHNVLSNLIYYRDFELARLLWDRAIAIADEDFLMAHYISKKMDRGALIEQAVFESRNLEIAKALIDHGIAISSSLLAKAIFLNDYPIFHFLAENGATIDVHHQQFNYFQKKEQEVDPRIVNELKEKYNFDGRFLFFEPKE